MKKIVIGLVLVVLVFAAIVLGGCGGTQSPTQPTPTPKSSIAIKATGRISAEGKVVPVRSAALGFQSGGIVAQVPVALGDSAEAGKLLAALETRQLELQLAQSEANLAGAQAKLNQLKRSPTAEDLAAAQQNLASAQAAYESLMRPSANEMAAVKADLEKSKALLDQATAAYERIGGDSNPHSGATPQRAQLQTAWLDYEKALTQYNAKINPTNAQVQQALAAIQNAKNQLAKLQPTAEDLAAAQASVNAAQAARDLAAEHLKNAKLVAPFSGRVTSLDVKAGEFVAAGAPIVRLADTANWQVETTDLTELNIVNTREGDAVIVTFDAIPNLELTGKIARIKGYGENKQGDIVYTLVIALDRQSNLQRANWGLRGRSSSDAKNARNDISGDSRDSRKRPSGDDRQSRIG
ncbi:MAG: HlyD family efflux transporter periplasmic adaptor subunit [Chloroflexi bacterium]|nr:HlyD family efflux transporter periplasmic adaptor subunit [Chloroflexota bacterium]